MCCLVIALPKKGRKEWRTVPLRGGEGQRNRNKVGGVATKVKWKITEAEFLIP